MITLTPPQYIEWLIGIKGMLEHDAVKHVEALYLKQTGKRIKMFQRLWKDSLVWDYEG